MANETYPSNPASSDEDDALQQATLRAERAEAELNSLKLSQKKLSDVGAQRSESAGTTETAIVSGGEEELRKDSMMAHLLDSLADGQDIGHYGRLVFAMVARYFMTDSEVIGWLTRDADFAEPQATTMLRQVEGRDYNPPKRDRILEWQSQQEFPILPHPDDPDCGNLYRHLKFPDSTYQNIEHYQEEKASA